MHSLPSLGYIHKEGENKKMPKYEIMLVVDGSVKETDAISVVNDLKTILKDSRDFKLDKWGLKDLAYPIKKKNRGYYFILNFYNENAESIKEFRRVTLLKKEILRHLVINLEKDYGYKAKTNPKKIIRSQFRADRYKRIKEQTLAEQEKIKKERDTTPVKLTDI